MAPRHRLIVLGLSVSLLGLGPCARTPGSLLIGPVATELPDDWSFVDELGTCTIETRPAFPHSVTVTCYSSEGELYVGSVQAAGKRWPQYVLDDPCVRYRAAGVIYELRATLVENSAERNQIFRARRGLGGRQVPPDLEAPAHYWIFHLGPR
ncbi:MAG: hypothetical protein V3V67_19125 [Myxococcota bacterium]